MKKSARWFSMEMAAMVTYTGAQIIQSSRDLLEKIGKVLELDTDGVWTLFPKGFPEKYELRTKAGKRLHFGYPCSLMNHLIHDRFKNPQYQDRVGHKKYSKRTEMSIYFELDGPYRAMVIPASTEENKKLKKKYCVFNFDGKISEIKGFELKRRGELEIIKKFQSEIFSKFLDGQNLKQCYDSCARTAQMWLDIILRKGEDMTDDSLFELIGESKMLSKKISDYGDQKGVALTAAKRMAEYLGKMTVLQSGGTRLDFVISRQPEGAPVSQRAIPISVFKLAPAVKLRLLKKWMGFPEKEDSFALKNLIDWQYYFERFSKNIQKIITIPAVLQGLENPIKDVPNPRWLRKRMLERQDTKKQASMTSFFKLKPKTLQDVEQLIGDMQQNPAKQARPGSKIILEEEPVQPGSDKENADMDEALAQTKKISISTQMGDSSRFGRFNINLLKHKWKSQFKKSRKQSHVAKIDNMRDLSAYVRRRVENSSWRVWKVAEAGVGQFLMHVVVEQKYLQRVLVSRDRRIFVNFFKDQRNDKWRMSKRKLPRDKTTWFMYQIDFNEQVFVDNFRHLDFFLSNVEVEGVYESQVDLRFLILRDLGVSCSIQKPFREQLNFDEKDKVYRIDSACLYNKLPTDSASSSSQRIFGDRVFQTKGVDFCLVWGVKKQNKTGIFVWGAKGGVLVLQGSTAWLTRKKTQVEFKQFLQNSIDELFRSTFGWAPDQSYKCDLELLESKDDLQSNLSSALEKLIARGSTSPCFVVCNLNDQLFSQLDMTRIEDHFGAPVLRLSLGPADHALISLNSLTWHKTLAKEGIAQLPKFEELVVTFDRLASFSQMPLGNLSGSLADALVQAMDVIFARKLEEMNHLSWYSKTRIPDLGQMGLINDEVEALLEERDEDNPSMNRNFNSRSVVQPGFYVTYVVEVKIGIFIINALINSTYFEEEAYLTGAHLESKASPGFLNPHMGQANEGLQNQAAFKVLKELIVLWFQKIRLEHDQSADLLITNLMAWLVSSGSRFHDPVLKKAFVRIITKAFDLLLVKIDELGGKIVSADYNSVLIDTNLVDIESACNFRRYIMENLAKENAFKFATFSEGSDFSLLIIHSKFDYIGVSHTDTGAESLFEIDCQLQMHLCLPPEMRTLFFGLLEFFVNGVHHELKKNRESGDQTGQEVKLAFEHHFRDFLEDKFMKNVFKSIDFIKENLKLMELETFLQKKREQGRTGTEMGNISCQSEFDKHRQAQDQFYVAPETGLAPDTQSKGASRDTLAPEADSFVDEDDYEQDSFVEDEDAASHENLHVNQNPLNAAGARDKRAEQDDFAGWKREEMLGQSRRLGELELEFVNLLFEVLNAGSEESGGLLQIMRKNAILYLERDFYSEESRFRPLMLSMMIHEVKCVNCRTVSSLDVFRDFQKLEPELKSVFAPYKCGCGEFFGKKAIEHKIISKLQLEVQKCMNQELFCEKCLQIQKKIFQTQCDCSGQFRPKDSALKRDIHTEIANGFINFRRLANTHAMSRLRRFVENIVF